jgi:para-nitrobenzyl esterase
MFKVKSAKIMAIHALVGPTARSSRLGVKVRPLYLAALALAQCLSIGCSARDEERADGPGTGDPLVVTLRDGLVRGDFVDGTRRLLKIPFAKAPIGDLRWKAPVKNDPWTGTRYETEFSAPCAQGASQGSSASTNEDCLYLNVWSPEAPPARAPVMVWIHGGANLNGSTSDIVPTTDQLWFDGQFFAKRHGVVLVTINYRLGALGFFPHAALPGEGSPFGNQGLLDQHAALEWVRDNIAAFGGDPQNVTIFGESAGATDVCYHVASPRSRGLFHRAIAESGGCTTISGLGGRPAAAAASDLGQFVEHVGCATAADALGCLRGKSVEDLLASATATGGNVGASLGRSNLFSVVVDGEGGFLPERTRDLFDRGDIARVPFLLGSNTDEGALFVLGLPATQDEAQYLDVLTQRYAEFAAQIAAQYPASRFNGDYRAALTRAVGDQIIVCSQHDALRRAAKAGLPVYAYNFNVVWSLAGGALKVSHASEISHVFGNPLTPTPESQAVSDAMNAYWARFAATGDPNWDGAPATWPVYGPDPDSADRRLQLDPEWQVLEGFRSEDCAMWQSLYAASTP